MRRQAGFTLIEILVTVALVGILAGLAIMKWGKSARKARASEVHAIFAELRNREEQYHLENGVYFSTGGSEAGIHPLAPNTSSKLLAPLPAEWTTLRVAPPMSRVYCGYVAIAGRAGDGTNIGAKAGDFGFTAPATDWYYLLARCNLDGNAGRDAYYFSTSADTTLQKENEGS